MATSFKTLGNGDIQSTRNKLHEAIPLTGSITSGTYGSWPDGTNIKNYPHGMFQSCYDYPYLSSSANHIFDLTQGYPAGSALSQSANLQKTQRINMYTQMAQVLVGYDSTGSVKVFNNGTHDMKEVMFVNFARLLSKDEIQKGTFDMTLGVNPTGGYGALEDRRLRIADISGTDNYKVDSPAGEYNVLYASNKDSSQVLTTNNVPCGLLYYQAGIAVISSSVFLSEASGGLINNAIIDGGKTLGRIVMASQSSDVAYGGGIDWSLCSASISGTANSFRERLQNISFNNTTELNSTIYFCRANAVDFNFSSNPTYLSASKIRVKEDSTDEPISYITTVGMYGANNEMLAVAKLSEPLKKTSSNEFTLRVRLDY